MKKLRKLLALLVFIMLIATSIVSGVASTTLSDMQLLQQYAVDFVKHVESTNNIEVAWAVEMKDLSNGNPIAQYISLRPTGYIVMGMNPPTVYEYSLEDQLIDRPTTGEIILAGPFSYYEKFGSEYVHLKTRERFSKTELSGGSANFQKYIVEKQSTSPREVLQEKASELAFRELNRGTVDENVLRNKLTTSYLETIDGVGCCGPDAAYAVLQYMGKLRDKAAGYQDEIKYIASLTGVATNLTKMKDGVQAYLKNNNKSGTVYSTSYNFLRVKECIKGNKPITLGTSGGNIASGGHIQTIYGYYHEVISSRSQVYILKIHSWGKSDYSIAYEINPNSAYPPTYLDDHIYIG